MEANPEHRNSAATTATGTIVSGEHIPSLPSPSVFDCGHDDYFIDDSNCSSPYVSAPSSPGHSLPASANVSFYYSAPTSPMYYVLASAPARSSLAPTASDASSTGSFEFDFSDRVDSPAPATTMSSADELFCNGQIRPMRLSAHLQGPQALAPLLDFGGELERENDGDEDDETVRRSRDLRFRNNRSQRRRARSLSPLRSTAPFDWLCSDDGVASPEKAAETEEREIEDGGVQKEERKNKAATPAGSGSRSSRRWDFLKDFLRSKSEGRSNNKFWHNISFSPAKERKERERERGGSTPAPEKARVRKGGNKESPAKKTPAPSPTKRRSVHEMHYAAKRAQAEERRKKTFLPYRQGVLGCLGFNSKSYGALNGFARSLNPVSSRCNL
ncbi:hypothetical protein Cgig2_015154 [Carnegiea gigantea]|uniref:Uncharacterized protein n=1 Tax=Carnegiea gigantea TaxID=171969 RepID=A0A9Q1KNG8_9CARY|nr:hypothetical protein Cgig2_015154 [Carnegiea gigantea]